MSTRGPNLPHIKLLSLPQEQIEDFYRYTRKLLIGRYKCLNFKIIYSKNPCFLAGPDLLRFYLAFSENNLDYLPSEVRLYHHQEGPQYICRFKEQTQSFGKNIQFQGEHAISSIISSFHLNCFQIALDLGSGEFIKTPHFDSFYKSKEVEFTLNLNPRKALKEAIEVSSIESVYFNKVREISVLHESIKKLDKNQLENHEQKMISLFLTRAMISKRKRTIEKVTKIISYPEFFRMSLKYCSYSVDEFDNQFKKNLSKSELKKCEKLLKVSSVNDYIFASNGILCELLAGIASLSKFFKNYPKFIETLFRLANRNEYGKLDKSKLLEILSDSTQRDKLGGLFREAKIPLELAKFKNTFCDYKLQELTTPFALAQEGEEMNHCLGSQMHMGFLTNKENRYFSIKIGKLRSTLELGIGIGEKDEFVIVDHKSKFNEEPHFKLKKYVDVLLKYINKTTPPSLLSQNDHLIPDKQSLESTLPTLRSPDTCNLFFEALG